SVAIHAAACFRKPSRNAQTSARGGTKSATAPRHRGVRRKNRTARATCNVQNEAKDSASNVTSTMSFTPCGSYRRTRPRSRISAAMLGNTVLRPRRITPWIANHLVPLSIAAGAALSLMLGAGLARAVPDPPDVLPLGEVKPGMKGYGLTVFSGTQPEKF